MDRHWVLASSDCGDSFARPVRRYSHLVAMIVRWWLVGILIGLIVPGCSKQVTYHAGVYTGSVFGHIQLEMDTEDAFVIVRRYDLTLIETAGGYRHRLSASVLDPGSDGIYSVPFLPETRRLDLTFVARDHRPVSFSFQRTLGVGAFEYDVSLVKDGRWKENYFLAIRPVLVDLIVEGRYRLSPMEQLFLGNWMDETENRL
jgi:hypothetical protein